MLVYEIEVNGEKMRFYKDANPVLLTITDIDNKEEPVRFFGESLKDAYQKAVYNIDDLYVFKDAYERFEKESNCFDAKMGISSDYDLKDYFIKTQTLEELKRYIRLSGYKVSVLKEGFNVSLAKENN